MAKSTEKTSKAAPPAPFPFQYAAKFICTSDIPGTSQQAPGLLPGVYETSVNLHNPFPATLKIRYKFAHPGGISDWKALGLKYDEVAQLNCSHLKNSGLALIHGFEGFLVIESIGSLDVVAVYTAGQRAGEVTSIDVEKVQERKL